MNTEILNAMIEKWRAEAVCPDAQDGPPSAELNSAIMHGERLGLARAADDLERLIKLMTPNNGGRK